MRLSVAGIMSQTLGLVSEFPPPNELSISHFSVRRPRLDSPTLGYGITSPHRPPTKLSRHNPASRPHPWVAWHRESLSSSWASTSPFSTRRPTAATTSW